MEQPSEARPPLNVEGELVALGPLRRDLIPAYHRWHSDVATTRTYALPQPATLDQDEATFAWMTAEAASVFFTVYDRAITPALTKEGQASGQSWRPVGTTYLTHIDHRHRRAEFGVLIGEVDARGKGYGTETARLMLDYAFTALALHSVMLTAYEYNLAGRRAYEKAGFKEFGRRQSHWMGGRYWDEICMDCLATEFASPVLGRRIFQPDPPRS